MEINNHKPYSRCRVCRCDVTMSNSIQDGGALVVNILVFDLRVQLQHCTCQRKILLFALIKVSTFICKREILGLSSPLTVLLQGSWANNSVITCDIITRVVLRIQTIQFKRTLLSLLRLSPTEALYLPSQYSATYLTCWTDKPWLAHCCSARLNSNQKVCLSAFWFSAQRWRAWSPASKVRKAED